MSISTTKVAKQEKQWKFIKGGEAKIKEVEVFELYL